MASPFSPLTAEMVEPRAPGRPAEATGDEVLLIAGFGDPLIADFAAFVADQGARQVVVFSTADVCHRIGTTAEAHPIVHFTRAALAAACRGRRVGAAILIMDPGGGQTALDAVAAVLAEGTIERICVSSTFRVHLGDRAAAAAEARILDQLNESGARMPLVVARSPDRATGPDRRSPGATEASASTGDLRSASGARSGDRATTGGARTLLVRPSHVLSPGSRVSAWLRALWFCHPLVPRRFTSCFVEGDELFAALLQEVTASCPRRQAACTLLGPNRPWREVLREHADRSPWKRGLAAAATTLNWLGFGWFLGLLFSACALVLPRLRRWSFNTLSPSSMSELLALYNRYNYRYVKVVGYNNGAVHFGQKHPGRTVVTTVRCNARARVVGSVGQFDAGATVRQAIEVLVRSGKELYVLPNYSYVCLGTSLFVPIHGSSSDFSTLGDTITRVLLYDPIVDGFVRARRDDPAFAECAYNLTKPAVLLRLSLRVKDRSEYFMERSRLEGPAAGEVLGILQDERPANVEIRKLRAADRAIDVYRYFTQASGGSGGASRFRGTRSVGSGIGSRATPSRPSCSTASPAASCITLSCSCRRKNLLPSGRPIRPCRS